MPPETQTHLNPTNPLNGAHRGNKRKHARLLILTGVMLFVGGLALWFFANNKVVPKSEPENLVAQNTNEFADWKTYRNKTYNYELKYPKDWIVDTTYSSTNFEIRGEGYLMGGDTYMQNYDWSFDPEQGPTSDPDDHHSLYLIIFREKTNKSVDQYFDLKNFPNQGAKLLEVKDFVVGNAEGRQYVTESLDHPVGTKQITTIFKNDLNFYVFKSPLKSREFHNKILSTFKLFRNYYPGSVRVIFREFADRTDFEEFLKDNNLKMLPQQREDQSLFEVQVPEGQELIFRDKFRNIPSVKNSLLNYYPSVDTQQIIDNDDTTKQN